MLRTEIVSFRRRTSTSWVAFGLTLFALFCGSVGVVAQPPSGPSSITAGKIFKVKQAGVETFVGTLQPKRQSTVGTAVEGRVISLMVEPGDPVTGTQSPEGYLGQPVMRLRTATLDIEIGAAEIQLKIAKQTLEQLEVSLPQDIDLAKTAASEAMARLDYSRTNFERLRRLGQGAISQGEVDQARSQYLADRQAAKGAEISYRKIKETSDLQIQQARSQVEAGQQELARLNDLREKYTIRAPFDGFVTEKLTEIGEWVNQGQAIVEVVQINPIEMVINVPQEYLPRLQESIEAAETGNTSQLLARVEIDGFNQPIKGVVKRIVQKADLRSRTFPVRLELKNLETTAGFLFQPGMLGKASLQIGTPREMLLVKKDALVLGGREPTVFKIVKQNGETSAVPIPVRTGASIGQWIQISGRVLPSDTVVLLGNERLRPGQKLRVKETDSESPPGTDS